MSVLIFPGAPRSRRESQAPSPCLLFAIFAERLLPSARFGVQSLLSKSKVSESDLARLLLCVAFWSLRQAALISLTPGHSALRVLRTTACVETGLGAIEAGIVDVLTPGSLGRLSPSWEAIHPALQASALRSESFRQFAVTSELLPKAMRDAGKVTPVAPDTVQSAVRRWFGPAVLNPEGVPVEWVRREGLQADCLTTADAGRNWLGRLFLGSTVTRVLPERVPELEGLFAPLFGRWQTFKAQEPALCGFLDKEITAALLQVTKLPSGSTDS